MVFKEFIPAYGKHAKSGCSTYIRSPALFNLYVYVSKVYMEDFIFLRVHSVNRISFILLFRSDNILFSWE